MTDLLGYIALGGMFLIFVAVFAAYAQSAAMRLAAAVGAVVWAAAIVALTNAGVFEGASIGPVPGVGYAVALALAVGFGGYLFVPAFRETLLAVPLPVLVALNIGRVFGGLFLILAAEGRLAAPFAPIAGWGDVAIALAAPIVLLLTLRSPSNIAIGVWNVLGALDLVVALTLGVLSAPETPIQVFTTEPGTRLIGSMPWIMIPTLLVPLWLLVHLTIAAKLFRGAPLGAKIAV